MIGSVKKGDIVKTAKYEGQIVKYPSNAEIIIQDGNKNLFTISKADILEIAGFKEVSKGQEKDADTKSAFILDCKGSEVVIGEEVTFEETRGVGLLNGILKFIDKENIFIWGDWGTRMLRTAEINSYEVKKV